MIKRERVVKESPIDDFLLKIANQVNEYEDALKIDKNDLDNELVYQGDLYYQVGKRLAEVISVRDTLKLERDKMSAELDRSIRIIAITNQEKVSEPQIANRIKEDPSYDNICREYIKVGKWSNTLESLQKSYEQRNYALSKLVDLYISGYFTETVGKQAKSSALEI